MFGRPTPAREDSGLAQTLQRAVKLHQAGKLEDAERLYRSILSSDPRHFDALHLLGVVMGQRGRNEEALRFLDEAVLADPTSPDAHSNRGNVLQSLERYQDALASYDKALVLDPRNFRSLNNRGNALQKLGRNAEALFCYDGAIALRPDFAEAFYNRGNVLGNLGDHEDALASYDRSLALRPSSAEGLYNRGRALQALGRLEAALASYDQALAIKPDHADALNNRGNVLHQLKRHEEALASYDKTLSTQPGHVTALLNRCNILAELGRPQDALASCDRVLALEPDHLEGVLARANILQKLGRNGEALEGFGKALAVNPQNADALNSRGYLLYQLRRYEEALASYDRALAIDPDHVDALNNRGNALQDLRRYPEALACYENVLAAKPDHAYALGNLAKTALTICDWTRAAEIRGKLPAHVEAKRIIAPLVLLTYLDDPPLQLQCARNCMQDLVRTLPRPLARRNQVAAPNRKIRIAYLSADFRRHPVGNAIAELFHSHDRSRFEVLAISFGPDDESEIRARIVGSFDRFHDVRFKSDWEIASLIHAAEVDIAVDLMGHTDGARPGILAYRPAPVQVSYLGYPGTTGAAFIDYLIADPTVLPLTQQPFYTEKIVHLPDCYLVNDSHQRRISDRTPARRELGLPEDGFVFCAFTQNHKIVPDVFEVWMRLLRALEGSVMWLSRWNDLAMANLRREAAARAVDPSRLVFAPPLDSLPDHLARHRRADLYLDTLPYNAHTSASNALWAGLPVLTCKGDSFHGRVGASLLEAMALPELVTHSLDEYESMALRLTRNPELLRGLRHRLEQNRPASPLFDTNRFRRNIEAAYRTMWELAQQGDLPPSSRVAP
jgi:protein O-GlcNAc transferase